MRSYRLKWCYLPSNGAAPGPSRGQTHNASRIDANRSQRVCNIAFGLYPLVCMRCEQVSLARSGNEAGADDVGVWLAERPCSCVQSIERGCACIALPGEDGALGEEKESRGFQVECNPGENKRHVFGAKSGRI